MSWYRLRSMPSRVVTGSRSISTFSHDRRSDFSWTRLYLTNKSSQVESSQVESSHLTAHQEKHHSESLVSPARQVVSRRVSGETTTANASSVVVFFTTQVVMYSSHKSKSASPPRHASTPQPSTTFSPNTSNSVHFRGRGRK